MNEHAQALGRLAKGKPKTLTEAERQRRREAIKQARKFRWLPKDGSMSDKGLTVRQLNEFRAASNHE
jgi:hypothetical protein